MIAKTLLFDLSVSQIMGGTRCLDWSSAETVLGRIGDLKIVKSKGEASTFDVVSVQKCEKCVTIILYFEDKGCTFFMNSQNKNQPETESNVTAFGGSYALFSDEKLVQQVRDGDERAFECLMTRHVPIVTAFLWGKMWERDEIADLTQEVFIRVYTKIDQLRDGARFNQWVLRIARHAWADHCRSPQTQRRKLHSPISDDGALESGAVDSVPTPDTQAGSNELEAMVKIAIGQLKEKYRVVLYLRLIESKSNSEIALLTGLKENAVRTRFSRGLEMLKATLIKKGLEPF